MEPAYLRIRRHVLHQIEAGTYGPGDRLPSETELAKQFSVTRNTVVHGLQSLVAQGRIKRIAGKGTYVSRKEIRITQHASLVRSFDEEVVDQGSSITFRLLGFNLMPAPDDIAAKLGLEPATDIFRLERVRIVDGTPTVQEVRFMPVEVGHKLTIDALSRLPMFPILAEQVGRPVARIEGVIRADAATDDVAQKLAVESGTPVLVRDYVLADSDGVPLVCGVARFRREVQIAYFVDSTR